MSDPLLMPQQLFAAVSRNEVWRLPDPGVPTGPLFDGFDPTGLLSRLDRELLENGRFYPGTGRQLADCLDAMLASLFVEASICKDAGLWISGRSPVPVRLGAAVKLAFAQFFGERPGHPAVLWSNGLCWTNKLVAQYLGLTIDCVANATESYALGQSISMRFTRTGGRAIELPAELMSEEYWLPPADAKPYDIWRMEKTWQAENSYNGHDAASAPFREQLGVVVDPIDEGCLAIGIHPAELGKSRSVWKDEAGRYGLAPGGTTNPPALGTFGVSPWQSPRPHFDPTTAKCVSSMGIFDVHLVKAKRYRLRSSYGTYPMVVYEEICFAIDRECGKLVYISSSSDSLPLELGPREESDVLRRLGA